MECFADAPQFGDGQSSVAPEASLKCGQGDACFAGKVKDREPATDTHCVDSLAEVSVGVGCHTETIPYPNGYAQASVWNPGWTHMGRMR